jgi:hypothetical protein
MKHRRPTNDELVDLSWLLDSALVVGDRGRAIDTATRLLESLSRHEEKLAGAPADSGPTTALRDACLSLTASVESLLAGLDRGERFRRVEFRHRVEALVTERVQPAA